MKLLSRIFGRKESSPPVVLERISGAEDVGFLARFLAEILFVLLERRGRISRSLPFSRGTEENDRRVIHPGLSPRDFSREGLSEDGDRFEPGERWAVINGRPTKIKIGG